MFTNPRSTDAGEAAACVLSTAGVFAMAFWGQRYHVLTSAHQLTRRLEVKTVASTLKAALAIDGGGATLQSAQPQPGRL